MTLVCANPGRLPTDVKLTEVHTRSDSLSWRQLAVASFEFIRFRRCCNDFSAKSTA
jgi:hypothetical protein